MCVLDKLVWSDCFAFVNESEFYRFFPFYMEGQEGLVFFCMFFVVVVMFCSFVFLTKFS